MFKPTHTIGDRVAIHAIPMTILRVLPVLDPVTHERAACCYLVARADGTRRIVTEGEIA